MKRFPTCSVLASAIVWASCLGALPLLHAQQAGDAQSALSSRRLAVLKRITRERLASAQGDIDQRRLEQDILGRFAIAEPGCPTGMIATPKVGDDVVTASTKRLVDELVEKRFPSPDAEKLVAEAEAKYPIVKKGELVEFYYATNPEIMRKVHGVYDGRNDAMIKVGHSVVRVEDIARVPNNAGLLLRFDPEASKKLRQAYVEDKLAAHETAKENYERQATQLTLSMQRAAATQANENEGYLWVNGEWTTARNLVGELVAAERERLAAIDRQKAAQRLARKRGEIAVAVDAQALHEAHVIAAAYVDVNAAHAAYAQRRALVAAATEVTDLPKPPEDSGTAKVDDPAVAAEASPAAPPAPAVETPSPQVMPVWVYAAIGAALIVIVVVIVAIAKRRASGPGHELKKFFQGRGKVQRTFWQMAEEKPDTFKYVAYRYPNAQDARQALLQLSYISERVGGDLVCRHDVYFGYGPHQEKFVCFVGGETLHYALWREASAVFPEYPGAEYFRVSTAPDVHLEIPNLESLLADPELQIEHVENREGEGTDYSQYYVYRAPGKDNALEFLKHAHIQEAGLHVVVLTCEGVFGKDANGIYEEPTELWAERYPDFFED